MLLKPLLEQNGLHKHQTQIITWKHDNAIFPGAACSILTSDREPGEKEKPELLPEQDGIHLTSKCGGKMKLEPLPEQEGNCVTMIATNILKTGGHMLHPDYEADQFSTYQN